MSEKIDFGKIKFLIIDDNKVASQVVYDILVYLGSSHVERTNNPENAFDIIRREAIDVVVTEWNLKGMSGLEFLEILRTSATSPNTMIPVIMLTANSEQEHVLRARDGGITEFLAKPFTAKSLFDRLATVIAKPRDFIKTESYFGPDRRRRQMPYMGRDRRYDTPT